MRFHAATVAAALLALLGCPSGPPDTGADDTWTGTINTEGDVTTVVNETGSVWGGAAALIEDASIGVETGADEYMFGRIGGVAATSDRIYVLDTQAALVRVYDHDGQHLFDFGGEGEGPGELGSSVVMGIDPAGRVLVQSLQRVNVLDLDGVPLTTWPVPGGLIRAIVVRADGTAFIPNTRRGNVVPVSPDGAVGEPLEVSDRSTMGEASDWTLMASSERGTRYSMVPFAPAFRWEILPSGAIVEGSSEAYGFSVRRADGPTLRIVRSIALPPVPDPEREWRTRQESERMRQTDPGRVWNADPIPALRPAFERFHGDRFGRIWVLRNLGGEAVAGCAGAASPGEQAMTEPCWRDVFGYDVFDEAGGRFLGEVRLPPGFDRSRRPAFREDSLIGVMTNEAGTIMVKRYRLLLPGG